MPHGSLLGGKFFNLLMDYVLNTLQDRVLRCHIDGVFLGNLSLRERLSFIIPLVDMYAE